MTDERLDSRTPQDLPEEMSLPSYCPKDGAEMDTERDELAGRATCPECSKRKYDGLLSWVLWKLPPRGRDGLMNVYRFFFDRSHPTKGLGLVRTVAFVVPLSLVLELFGGIVGAAIIIGLVLVGVSAFEAVLYYTETRDGTGGSRFAAGDVVLAGANVVYLYHAGVLQDAVAAVVSLRIWPITLPPTAEIVDVVAFFVAGVVGFYLSYSVFIRIHERLHWAAFRYFGVDARVVYYPARVVGIVVGYNGGETIPRPSSWTGPEWQSAVIGLAPTVLLVPLAIAVHFGLFEFIVKLPIPIAGLALGAVITWLFAGIPSPGDIGTVATVRYTTYERAKRATEHRFAEGIPTP